jgi:hypothetical protein
MPDTPSRRDFISRAGVAIGAAALLPALPPLARSPAHAQFAGVPKMIVSPYPSFVKALIADHPAEDRADKLRLYAFLIGRWDMDGVIHRDDGTTHKDRGSIHAGWVLEGRALQDVWIFPGFFYASTTRASTPGTSCGATR